MVADPSEELSHEPPREPRAMTDTTEAAPCAKRGCARPATHKRWSVAGPSQACDEHVVWLDECIRLEDAAGCHPMCPPAWALHSSTNPRGVA